MVHRTLGPTGPSVSRLGLGGVTFGREIDEATSFAILDHALAHGITLVDTAEAYGPPLPDGSRSHASEQIIGRWLAAHGGRNRVVVETKLLPPLTPARIAAGIDAALARLRVDAIDLFLFHAPDGTTPIGESLMAASRAIEAGKVKHVGASNFSARQVEAADDEAQRSSLPRFAVLQCNYNLAIPEAAADLFPLCRSRGIGVQTYSPLGAGFLMGKYAPGQTAMPAGTRFDLIPGHAAIYCHPPQFARARRLAELEAATGVPRAELAIAWTLRNADVDNVLIGARRPEQIDVAIRAASLRFDPAWDAALRDDAR